MTGTIVNVAAVLVGGFAGLALKKGVKESIRDSIMKTEGLAVLIIGANGVINSMFKTAEDGSLTESGGMLLLVSLVLGTFVGELLKIDDRVNGIGLWVERRFHTEGFAKGFVTSSVIFCVGSMTIIGSLNDGLRGDPELLFMKSLLDGVTALILASTMGAGVLGAAVPVLVCQGTITLSASVLAPLLSAELMDQISMAGYAIVMAVGINFIVGQKIKTANMLPAIFVPVLYNLLTLLKSLWL